MTKDEKRLPLGAVSTANGEVMVPASRRADGSTRKPIRIRHGYVPQDEVPKYKTIRQRQREQEMQSANEAKAGKRTAVEELSMDKLSLESTMEAPTAKERLRSNDKAASYEEKNDQQQQLVETERTETTVESAVAEAHEEKQQQLKRQLVNINKQLKEIATLEAMDTVLLGKQQKQKIARKTQLQQEKTTVIAELNGATVTKSSSTATGPRPKVTISL